MILCLDPGINASGVALFDGSALWSAFLVRLTYSPTVDLTAFPAERAARMAHLVTTRINQWGPPFPWIGELVLEWPQVYQRGGGRTKGDPNDLLPLAGVDAALCVLFLHARVVAYKPREWKGTLDGDAMVARVEERLTPDELATVEQCPASLRHNVMDAIGIGLRHVGRLEKRSAIHR